MRDVAKGEIPSKPNRLDAVVVDGHVAVMPNDDPNGVTAAPVVGRDAASEQSIATATLRVAGAAGWQANRYCDRAAGSRIDHGEATLVRRATTTATSSERAVLYVTHATRHCAFLVDALLFGLI